MNGVLYITRGGVKTVDQVAIGAPQETNEGEGGQLSLIGTKVSDGYMIDQIPGQNKYGCLRFFSDASISKEPMQAITFTYNNFNSPVLSIGDRSGGTDSRLYVRDIEGIRLGEDQAQLYLNFENRNGTINYGPISIVSPSLTESTYTQLRISSDDNLSGGLLLQNFAVTEEQPNEGFQLVQFNSIGEKGVIDFLFDQDNNPFINLFYNINCHQDLIANGIISSKNLFLHQNDNLDITSTFTSDYRLVPFQVNDKNGKSFFYSELYLNGTNEIKSRIVLSNRAQNWYPYLEIGVTESNTPYICTNVSNTGNDTELARCDWVKNQINFISGQDVITIYSGKTGILNNDGTDTSWLQILFKKSGNSGIIYGSAQLSRNACATLRNNRPNLTNAHSIALSTKLYGYLPSTYTNNASELLTYTLPYFYDSSEAKYSNLETYIRTFVFGLSSDGNFLMSSPEFSVTNIANNDIIFIQFIGLCHV